MSDTFSAVKAQEEALLCRSYSRYPVAVVRGKGSRVWDVDGKEYVDLLAGIARFHVYVTPPSPNREIDFILEYDASYLSTLFE